jgi:O-antigen/teichoic acid export membrane protein
MGPESAPAGTVALPRLRDPRIMRACLRPTKDDLGGRVIRGAAWMSGLIVTRTVLTIGATAVLARLLTPTDYGFIAMAAIVTELAAALCVFGLPAIIVQTPRLRRIDLDSVFWFSVMLGVVVTTLLVAAATPIAAIFREPRLAPILWAMSALILFDEFSTVQQSIAYRLMLFRFEVICQLANLLVRIVVSIALAFAGFGVWSLVWGSVAGRAVQFVMIWYLIPYVPRARFSMNFIRRNVRTGGSYFGSEALGYVRASVDTATVGWTFGATQLGFYQTAFALPEELRSRVSLALQRVLFPAYAMVQSDEAAFQHGVLRSVRLFATIAMPMGIGMVVLAQPIVRTLYGEQWLPVVPLLRILAIAGVLRALQALLANIYKAKGRPDLDFKIGVGLLPLLVIAVLAGTHWDTPGVAFGILLFNVALLASTVYALRLIGLGLARTLAVVLPATSAAALMGLGLAIVDLLYVGPRPTVAVELAVSVTAGAILFFAALYAISRSTIDEIRELARLLFARPSR